MYDFDTLLGFLVTQAPPNDGVLNTVGSLGLSTGFAVGFDIYSEIDDATGRAVSNTAYAALNRQGGRAKLYTIDRATGQATKVGNFRGLDVRDIAVFPDQT